MSNPITGSGLVQWLRDTGLIAEGQHAFRVLIDIKVDDVVRVYVEEFGSDQILKVDPPDLKSAEVKVLPAGNGEMCYAPTGQVLPPNRPSSDGLGCWCDCEDGHDPACARIRELMAEAQRKEDAKD